MVTLTSAEQFVRALSHCFLLGHPRLQHSDIPTSVSIYISLPHVWCSLLCSDSPFTAQSKMRISTWQFAHFTS